MKVLLHDSGEKISLVHITEKKRHSQAFKRKKSLFFGLFFGFELLSLKSVCQTKMLTSMICLVRLACISTCSSFKTLLGCNYCHRISFFCVFLLFERFGHTEDTQVFCCLFSKFILEVLYSGREARIRYRAESFQSYSPNLLPFPPPAAASSEDVKRAHNHWLWF